VDVVVEVKLAKTAKDADVVHIPLEIQPQTLCMITMICMITVMQMQHHTEIQLEETEGLGQQVISVENHQVIAKYAAYSLGRHSQL
jgi:hypothetical protein